jgi:hypothetical protein
MAELISTIMKHLSLSRRDKTKDDVIDIKMTEDSCCADIKGETRRLHRDGYTVR